MRLERFLRGIVAGLLATLLATGLFTLAQPLPTPAAQLVQIGHDILGYALLPFGAAYVLLHLYQTIETRWLARRVRHGLGSLRRPAVAARALGVLAALATANAVVAAFVLSVYDAYAVGSAERGLREIVLVVGMLGTTALLAAGGYFALALRKGGLSPLRVRWLLLIAVVIAAGSGVVLPVAPRPHTATVDPVWLVHVVTAMAGLALGARHVANARRAASHRSTPAPRSYPWRGPLAVAAVVATITTGWTAWRAIRDAALLEPLEVDANAIVPIDAGFARIAPAGCESCHITESETWASSSHAFAAANPVFEALLIQTNRDAGPETARFCLRCHAPHAPDPVRTPIEDVLVSDGLRSGVHCLTCHRGAAGPGHGDGSFTVEPLARARVTFLHERPGRIGEEMRAGYSPWILIGSRLPLHRESFKFETAGARSCMPCHVQTLTMPTKGRLSIALQDQFDSWAQSPAATAGRDCRSCHMPRQRDTATRLRTDHAMRAASTYVAGVAAGPQGIAEVIANLEGRAPSRPLSAFDAPHGPTGPLLDMQARRRVRAGETVIEIRTRNTGRIGHSFPNGPTDLMQIWLDATLRDGAGRTLLEVGRDGPEDGPRLGHRFIDDHGDTVLDHRLWEVASVVDLGHVPSTGMHVVRLRLPAGTDRGGPVQLTAAWRYRRLDPDLLERMTGRREELPVATVGALTVTLP